MEIETGKQISVLASGVDKATDYEQVRYKFTDLPAGTFAVKFENGSTSISTYLASPANRGESDTLDSDGIAEYSEDKTTLNKTVILGISMPIAEKMSVVLYESKYHDSGFYERGPELPDTGGMGTTIFYILGSGLVLVAVVLFVLKKRMRAED